MPLQFSHLSEAISLKVSELPGVLDRLLYSNVQITSCWKLLVFTMKPLIYVLGCNLGCTGMLCVSEYVVSYVLLDIHVLWLGDRSEFA